MSMLAVGQKFLRISVCPKHSRLHTLIRTLYTEDGYFGKFNFNCLKDVEDEWKPKLKEHDDKFTASVRQSDQETYYVLSMFPYPSGALHMGHVRVYTISDVMARYERLTGKYVLHPMGWDAFGLPAENAAIERGEVAEVWTRNNITSMKKQMEELCLSFNWDRGFATCDPEYYKWTQWIFLKMYERGLVTQKMGSVDWDPVDQTVLAAEQIDDNGCSWRSGATVEKRFLKQWYINTTTYTKSLVDGLSEVDSDLWQDVRTLQQQWLGQCNGTHVHFTVMDGSETLPEKLTVFTERPELLYGVSHIILDASHYFNNKQYYTIKEDAVEEPSGYRLLRLRAIHPLTGESLPVVASDRQTPINKAIDAHLGIPSVNESDKTLAKALSADYREVVSDTGQLCNSGQYSGLSYEDGFVAVNKKLQELGCGGHVTSDLARDWLISRQRYWGTPIPIIHCPKKGAVPVPYEDLPVILPTVTTLTGKGQSPLTTADQWRQVKCPGCDCGSYGLRETDTMDTFVDSSWYFLRYLDNKNTDAPFSAEAAKDYIPVDLYIGGKEHATMHLYYARFVCHFLHDEGLLPQREPFHNLLTQGLVKGMSYYVAESNKFLRSHEVSENQDKILVETSTGKPVEQKWMKMSKSKHNGVDPQEVLDEYGCDATRLAILSNTAPKSDRNWNTDVFSGVKSWMGRLWNLVASLQQSSQTTDDSLDFTDDMMLEIAEHRNYFVHEVNHHMKKTFLLSVAISRLQGFTNALRQLPPEARQYAEYERALCDLVIMVAPFAPLYSMVLWEGLCKMDTHHCTHFNWSESIWDQRWPRTDSYYTIPLKIKINGKPSFKVPLPQSLDESTMNKSLAISLAKTHKSFEDLLAGKKIKSCAFSGEPGLRYELQYVTKDKKKK